MDREHIVLMVVAIDLIFIGIVALLVRVFIPARKVPVASITKTTSVHVVMFDGASDVVSAAVDRMKKTGNGWIQLQPGVWMVGSALNPQELRDIVAGANGLQVFVAGLSDSWAVHNSADVAAWLKGAVNEAVE